MGSFSLGHTPTRKLITVAVILSLTAAVVYFLQNKHSLIQKKISLMQALSSVPGWKVVSSSPLPDDITTSLRLDDYINATYSDGQSAVSLYIGYYYSNKKIGAAHDPMVCFPGQGWMVSENGKGEIKVEASTFHYIKYSRMVVSKGDQKDLIVYWFQSYNVSSADTFTQKVQAFLNNFSQNAQGNAFVRVTVSFENMSSDHAQKIAEKFIKAFYPVFLTYIYDI